MPSVPLPYYHPAPPPIAYATAPKEDPFKSFLCAPGDLVDYLLLGYAGLMAVSYTGVFCLFLCDGPWKGYRQVNSMFGIVGALGALALRHLGACK